MYAVLDRILDKRLQSKRRELEICDPDIICDGKIIVKSYLLDREVSFGMFEFIRECDRLFGDYRCEVFTKVRCELEYGMLRFFGVLFDQIIDAREGVIDEVRTHLKSKDTCILIIDPMLLFYDIPDVFLEDKCERCK